MRSEKSYFGELMQTGKENEEVILNWLKTFGKEILDFREFRLAQRIDVDFGDQNYSPLVSNIEPTGSVWDESDWDEALWSSGTTTFNEWQSIGALGTALAIRAKLNLLAESSAEQANPSLFDSGVFDSAVFDGSGVILSSGQDLPVVRFNQFQVILEHGAAVG